MLSLVFVCLPAVVPLLEDDVSCGYDNAFHLYRAVQIEHLWRQGVLFSRWAPDMAHGLGFPLFVFGPALSQSLLALIHMLGEPWPRAMNVVFLMGIGIGGAGVFALAQTFYAEGGFLSRRQRRDPRPAVAGHAVPRANAEEPEERVRTALSMACGAVATVAYVYAPFFAYDIYNRGSLWGAFGWAFPPWVLLGLHRWSRDRDRRYLVVGVAAYAGMILTHQLFAFLFAPVFALWAVLQGLDRKSWAVVGRGALLGGLALGVTAFFWLPAVAERGFIQPDRYLGTWVFDYQYNFLPTSHLLALPRRADRALINDWPQKALGAVPLLVAFVPALGWRRFTRTGRRQLALLWVLLVGFAALTQPVTLPLWDRVPLLSFLQFPWRFLAPASFCLAVLAGAAPAAFAGREYAMRPLDSPAAARAVPLICALVLANLGWFYPQACAPPGDLSIPGMLAWERATDTIGTTATSEYLPVWVERFPEEELDAQYGTGGQIVRLPLESMPAGASICDETYGPMGAVVRVMTPEAFTARYLAFYYPGWRVTVDGARVPVAPEPETGLLTFEVPAGQHHIEVAFAETPLRIAADAVSILSVVGLCTGIALASRRSERSDAEPVADHGPPLRGQPSSPGTAVSRPLPAVDPGLRPIRRDAGAALEATVLANWLLTVGLVLMAARNPVADGLGVLWRASRWDGVDTVAGISAPSAANFGDQAVFLGAEDLPQAIASDDPPVLTLYWRALEPTGADWRVGLTLVGPDGSRWPVGTRPARWSREPGSPITWQREGYARMDLLLDTVPGMAPGSYRLELALFDRATATPASVLDQQGNPVGPALDLGEVSVVAPGEPPALASLGVPDGAGIQTCGALGLWHAGLNRERARPGDVIELSTVWESLTLARRDLSVAVLLTNGSGSDLASWDLPAATTWWPTSAWAPGQRWLGRHDLRLPGSLETGAYTLAVSLGDCALASWTIGIEAPDRIWALPEGFVATDYAFGELALLAGHDGLPETVPSGERIDLGLAWQAMREITAPYLVFVHVIDADGILVAQNDGEPVGWTRPTPGWAVGEVVVDPRPLELPDDVSGPLTIRAGLYRSDGTRLLLPDGTDGAELGEVKVGE